MTSNENAAITTPAASKGCHNSVNKAGDRVAATTANWTRVLMLETTPAPAQAVASSGCARARAPMPAIVAVLDANPPASPARSRPVRGPKARMAM